MGYYNILKYFLRRLFYFLRSITGKLFIIFILLFCCLILYICIDKGVFASTYNWAVNDPFTTSDVSAAESKVGSNEWNADDEDIILCYIPTWGTYSATNNMKGVVYWKVDTSLTNCAYYVDTNNLYTAGNTNVNFFDFCLANLSNGNIGITNYVRKSWARYQNVTEGNWASYNNVNNVGWYSVYSTKVGLLDNSAGYRYSPLGVQNINGVYNIFIKPIRTHYDFVDSDGNVIIPATNPLQTSPYIENQSTTIENWSFDYLNINSGSVGYVYYDELLQQSSYATLNLKYTYDGITYTQSIPSGFLGDWSENNFTLSIPKTWLLSNVNIQNGKTIDFYLEVKKQNVSDNIYYLGTYSLTLTSAEQDQIQQDSDKALQGEILQSQQQTNNKLDNIDNTINDSNVDDITSNTLPSDSTTDITANGVNGIFTSIYNAFCVGNAQDIVFPIPFTDKSITLSPNYISDALTNSGATFIITIIQAFWWYIISRFIIKDVMNKINKIKSGNIEDIETTNIRGDML